MKTEQGSIQLGSQTFEAVKTDFDSYSRETGEIILQRLNCPHEYQEVEYLESNGTQWINSKILVSVNNAFEVKTQVLSVQNRQTVFGARYTSSELQRANYIIATALDRWSINKEYYSVAVDIDASSAHKINVAKDGTIAIDDVTKGKCLQTTTEDNPTFQRNIYLFALNTNNTIEFHDGAARIYYMKIWHNDILVRDYVPCYRKSDRKPGLWDKVSSTFFTNDGTGEFIVGSAIPCEDQTIFESTKVSGQ